MKKIIVSSLLLSAALCMQAQENIDLRLQPYLNESAAKPAVNNSLRSERPGSQHKIKSTPISDNSIDLLLSITDSDAVTEIENLGIEVTEVIGNTAVCTVPVDKIDDIARIKSVKSISAARERRLLNNIARDMTAVDDVHSGKEILRGFTGKGVVVGIIDGGLDPNHVNFLDEDLASTRVKRLWKFTKTSTKTYKTAAEIAKFTTDDDEETHGTHVLGIAAGAYHDSSSDYQGMAPDAEIAICCGELNDNNILKGIGNIIKYADEQGKPCVINISLGSNIGHHDGSDPFCSAINTYAETTPIMIAAGNEADLDIVIKKTTTKYDKTVKTFLVPNRALKADNKYYAAIGEFEILCSDATPFTVKVGFYENATGRLETITAGKNKWTYFAGTKATVNATSDCSLFGDYYDQESYIGAAAGICPDNGKYYAYVDCDLYKNSSRNLYTPVIIVEGEPGKTYEIYGDGVYTDFSDKGIDGWDEPTSDGTINDMACGENTIAVGAYAIRNVSPSYTGKTIGDITDYSSYGTLADGRRLPHICAPGDALISSFSRHYIAGSEYSSYYEPIAYKVTHSGVTHNWSAMGGTSMATPVMTGVAALWLEANPELSPAQIRNIAMETAVKDNFVTLGKARSDVQWGAGKLNAYAGMLKVLDQTTVMNITEKTADRITLLKHSDSAYEIYAPAESHFTTTVYDMAGNVLINQSTDGCMASLDVEPLVPGIYIVHVNGSFSTSTAKIAVR